MSGQSFHHLYQHKIGTEGSNQTSPYTEQIPLPNILCTSMYIVFVLKQISKTLGDDVKPEKT